MKNSQGVSTTPKSILVVAGETSGEEHAAEVVRALRELRPGGFQWFGSGGPRMDEQGVELMTRIDSLAAIGPVAACSNLLDYLRLFRRIQKRVRQSPPALAVLVDFPEFNLRLASRLSKQGIPVCYFISPQIWAWRPGRVSRVRRHVARMLVILPFEVTFYRRHGVDAVYVGNPIARLKRTTGSDHRVSPKGRRGRIALLPGSRRKEIDQIFPVQLEAAALVQSRFPCSFRVVAAPEVDDEHLLGVYQKWRKKQGPGVDLEMVRGPIEKQLPWADCAIVKSGTSTLQAMVLKVPFAMVYRMSELSYRLLRPLVRTESFCLANLVAGRQVAPEFVQGEAQGKAIAAYLLDLLTSPDRMQEVKQNLEIASKKLGTLDAYAETAKEIVTLVEAR